MRTGVIICASIHVLAQVMKQTSSPPFQLPAVVCAYQQVHYELTVYGPDSEVLYHDGPHSRFYGEGEDATYIFEDFQNITFVYATVRFGMADFGSSSVITAYRNFSKSKN